MKTAYQEGRDLYATIAMGVYKNSYWDNMEHHEDGSPNPEGKKRRGNCKQVLLGISYGLGVPALAERMGLTVKEAQQVMEDFYKAFPQVKDWQDKTISDAKKFGYVEDIWGRRRRLPSINLPQYDFVDTTPSTEFNPFIDCQDRTITSNKIEKYQRMIKEDLKKSFRDRKASIADTIKRAQREGVIITDNSGKLVHAENQCVNARIQGSAATMTKKAMINIFNDEELNNLGFKLLIGVHDELIGECPKENASAVADRLSLVMRSVVADIVDIPFKCDAEIEDHWYISDYTNTLKNEYEDLVKSGLGREESFRVICKEHTEMTKEDLQKIIAI